MGPCVVELSSGYVRDSNLDQADGFGPENQRHNEERFAETYGLVLGNRLYVEFVSGRSMARRDVFKQVMEDAALDRFDVLLVNDTSRFGRNQGEAIRNKEQLQRLGKTVVFVSQGIISGSDRDFLSERINETLDEQYSRNLSRHVTAGLAEKASMGHAIGRAPLGYRQEKNASGRGAWAAPDEKTMPALLHLLRGYTSGKFSFRTLAQDLNSKGYQTSDGRPFTESSISTVLNNRFYDAITVYHRGRPDEQIRDGIHHVPPEVRDLWRRCQEVRRERGKPGRTSPPAREQRIYPFSGVTVCNECEETYHGITTHWRDRRYPRMAHSWRRCGAIPSSVSEPAMAEEFAERVLACVDLDGGWREAVVPALANEGPKPDHSLDIKRIQGALANLRKQHLWDAVGDEEFKTKHREFQRQIGKMEESAPPAVTPNLDRAAKLLQDLPAVWRHPGVTPEQRRELVREVFQEIRLREGRMVAVKPKPSYQPLFAYNIWSQELAGGVRSS